MKQRHCHTINSAIHKVAGLTVPGRFMILPGTIPETPISREWGWWLEWSLRVIPAGECLASGFVNSSVSRTRCVALNAWALFMKVPTENIQASGHC